MIENCLIVGGQLHGCWRALDTEEESYVAWEFSNPPGEHRDVRFIRRQPTFHGEKVTIYSAEDLEPSRVFETVFALLERARHDPGSTDEDP